MDKSILAPAAVLIVWSIIMLGWLAATRLPAMKKMGVDMSKTVGARGSDIDPNVAPSVAWKSHNYAHLMEQPTLFYATVFIIHLTATATPLLVWFAWGYVALRVVHSLWQATVNKVSIRFVLFLLSTICLAVLSVNALLATI
ncbi:MAG: MAPEG family protein [Sphingorhabdus sp.]